MIEFIRDKGRITKDSIAGRTGAPLATLDWQDQLIRLTFARDPQTGRRRHRTAYWSMARKNGKTGIVAPIALQGLILEGDGAEVYSCAADRKQAGLVFEAAKRTVELDPELRGMLKCYRDAIEYPATGSVYRALSSEAFTKEGLSPTLVIADELHAWPTRELYDVMALAMGARRDPLMLIVTTAGVKADQTGGDSICYTLYQYGRRVAAGEVDDPTFFFACWEAPTDCRPDDPKAQRAANPGLGVILDPSELQAQARKALIGGMSESEYRIKRLNQWVNTATAALPHGLFESRKVDRRLTRTEPIVLFFDGSFNHDSTGLVGCSLDGHLETMASWERPIDNPAWRVPISEVDARVRELCRDYNVVELAADPYRWAKEMQEWMAADLPVVEYPTSSPSRMVPAWAKFYDGIVAGAITHDGDPRLVRHIGNMILKVDRLGPRPVKDHRGSPRSIDLGICAVGAYDRATAYTPEEEPEILVAYR